MVLSFTSSGLLKIKEIKKQYGKSVLTQCSLSRYNYKPKYDQNFKKIVDLFTWDIYTSFLFILFSHFLGPWIRHKTRERVALAVGISSQGPPSKTGGKAIPSQVKRVCDFSSLFFYPNITYALHTATWMTLENSTLSERSKT